MSYNTRQTNNDLEKGDKKKIMSLEQIISNNEVSNFDKSIKLAGDYGILESDIDNYQHRCHHHIKDKFFSHTQKKNVVLFQSVITLKDILLNLNNEAILNELLFNIDCGRMEKKRYEKYTYNNEYLAINLKVAMLQKKTIFIMFVLEDYGINNEDGEDDEPNEYIGHSTCMILEPNTESYKAYYINPHGCDTKDTNYFNLIISRKRSKNFTFKKATDIVFIEKFIAFVNKLDFLKIKESNIEFKDSPEQVYCGADLQGGDCYGVCFVYPMIIWYYFGRYFTSTREIKYKSKSIKMEKGKTLLKNGKLNVFIESMFIDFNEKYKKLVVNNLINHKTIQSKKLNKLIEKEENKFTDSLVNNYISFVTQDKMYHKIINYFAF